MNNSMQKSAVVCVDSNDTQIGIEEKVKAHKGNGILHRAVSVVVVRKQEGNIEMLLQKRAKTKMLWPAFWTNSMCTHPQENESYEVAASRRFLEEMGVLIDFKDFYKGFRFEYTAHYKNIGIEHELDTVCFCAKNVHPIPDTKEVEEWKWISILELQNDMKMNASRYTPWFHLIMENIHTNQIILSLCK
jgi:isopentenyl-diphosphate Delta-isomerase